MLRSWVLGGISRRMVSISLCLRHAKDGTHWDLKTVKTASPELTKHSRRLRRKAVAWLKGYQVPGPESDFRRSLVEEGALYFGCNFTEYFKKMLRDDHGGKPELVALANALKRAIHVYEVRTTTSPRSLSQPTIRRQQCSCGPSSFFLPSQPPCFYLYRLACFEPHNSKQREKPEPLRILYAHSSFPNIKPDQQSYEPDHYLALLPTDYGDDCVEDEKEDYCNNGDSDRTMESHRRRRQKKRLRGGGGSLLRWTANGRTHRHHVRKTTSSATSRRNKQVQNNYKHKAGELDSVGRTCGHI